MTRRKKKQRVFEILSGHFMGGGVISMCKIRILYIFCKRIHLLSTIHDNKHNFSLELRARRLPLKMSNVRGARFVNSRDMQMPRYSTRATAIQ